MLWVSPNSPRDRRQPMSPDPSFDREAQAYLRLLSREVKELRTHLALRRLGLKYDGQPREEDGKYTFGRRDGDAPKDPGLITRPALLGPAVRVATPAIQKGIEAALALYAALSKRNTSESTAVFEFNARAFQKQPIGDPKPEPDQLTKEEVKKVCDKLDKVQSITDQAAGEAKREDHLSPQQYGTAVHTRVQRAVNEIGDPNFRAEISATKSGPARYGKLDSTRIDVFENPGTGTVCVYDIKTGEKTGLSFARMLELASAANRLYPGTSRIIVTEVRPSR